MQTVETGVLVIGGGGAAARAAVEAHRAGGEVMLVTKGSFGAVGTRGAGATAGGSSAVGVFATPGWSGSLSGREKAVAHMVAAPAEQAYENIIQVGLGMADPKLARIMVEDAVEMRKSLLEWGAVFAGYGIRSHGVPIMEALVRQIRQANIAVRERTMIASLLVQDGECLGAIAVDENSGETVVIKAGATVIGTGGDANLFLLNLNPSGNTGDGYAMGYEAGAELMNLEFKQIFLGTVYPTMNMLTQATPPHVKLTNALHEEFLTSYLPARASVTECLAQRQGHNPFSTRDPLSRYVDIAIIGEVQTGQGTEHHGIYLDRTDPRIPPIAEPVNEFWQYRGIDFTRPIEAGVCHHCSLGGLRIDENAETTVHHLYAAGEAAAGPHGADRMGGHMLLASQIFGARAGRHAASYVKGKKPSDIDSSIIKTAEERIESLRQSQGEQNPAEVRKMLQRSSYFKLLVIRSRDSLTAFLDDVRLIAEELVPHLSVTDPRELVVALELQNLLTLAELEANICLYREESRGPHFREDFPMQDDKNWLKCTVAKKAGDRLHLDTVALDPAWRSKGDTKIGYWG